MVIDEIIENKYADLAFAEGIADAEKGLPMKIPTWVCNRFGYHSKVAKAYEDAYNETKRYM